jgi:hypothetical protein
VAIRIMAKTPSRTTTLRRLKKAGKLS